MCLNNGIAIKRIVAFYSLNPYYVLKKVHTVILNRINVEFSMEISVLRYLEPKYVSVGMYVAVFCFAVTVVFVDIVWTQY